MVKKQHFDFTLMWTIISLFFRGHFQSLIITFWRFMELHLHKIAVLVLFATSLSQINAAYWVLLVLVLL